MFCEEKSIGGGGKKKAEQHEFGPGALVAEHPECRPEEDGGYGYAGDCKAKEDGRCADVYGVLGYQRHHKLNEREEEHARDVDAPDG
jgi:hypothetical protein